MEMCNIYYIYVKIFVYGGYVGVVVHVWVWL